MSQQPTDLELIRGQIELMTTTLQQCIRVTTNLVALVSQLIENEGTQSDNAPTPVIKPSQDSNPAPYAKNWNGGFRNDKPKPIPNNPPEGLPLMERQESIPATPGKENVESLLTAAKEATRRRLEKLGRADAEEITDRIEERARKRVVHQTEQPTPVIDKKPEEVLKEKVLELIAENFADDIVSFGAGKIGLASGEFAQYQDDLLKTDPTKTINYPIGFYTNQNQGSLQFLLPMNPVRSLVIDSLDKSPILYMLTRTDENGNVSFQAFHPGPDFVNLESIRHILAQHNKPD